MTETNLFIIIVCSTISSCLCCFCFKYYLSKRNEENKKARIQNTKILLRNKIQPSFEIVQPICDETKDAFEQYSIRKPQITSGDENV